MFDRGGRGGAGEATYGAENEWSGWGGPVEAHGGGSGAFESRRGKEGLVTSLNMKHSIVFVESVQFFRSSHLNVQSNGIVFGFL